MTLLQPSFRGRLRLFFAVIVVVPIIAIGVVLFRLIALDDTSRLDERLSAVRTAASNLYGESRNDARRVGERIARDEPLAQAIADEDEDAAQARVEQLARQYGTRWLDLDIDDLDRFRAGSPLAIAAVALPLAGFQQPADRAAHALDDHRRGIRPPGSPGARRAGAHRSREHGAGLHDHAPRRA